MDRFVIFTNLKFNYFTHFNGSLGNVVKLNWPKLFQAFSVKFTVIIFHECVHSIIPHHSVHVKIMHIDATY